MPNECIICGKLTGMFDKKTPDGVICSECFSYIPTVIDYRTCTSFRIERLIEKNKEYRKIFTPTTSLGSLYLDNIHKMFCLSNREKRGEPVILSNIFPISDIKEVGLYCKDPRNTGSGNSIRIVCDVEFYVRTDEIVVKEIILRNEPCVSKKTKDNKIEWEEPGVLSMFRSVWTQMATDQLNTVIKKIQTLQNNTVLLWSEGIMHLSQKYNHEELTERYHMLKQLYAGCEDEHAKEVFLGQLEAAYKLLDENLSVQQISY